MPLFPLLSSHDWPTRLDASLSLLTALPAVTAAESTASDVDTSYTLTRLVNGLGSSNDAARQGFAVALTELVSRLPYEQARTVLPLVLSTSTPTGSADGREERDLLFGRLLGLHALVRSGVLVSVEDADGQAYKEVILALLALSGRKSWMREPAYWAMTEAVRALMLPSEVSPGSKSKKKAAATGPAWKDEMSAWLVQRLLNDSREKARGWSPEKVALVLALQSSGVVSLGSEISGAITILTQSTSAEGRLCYCTGAVIPEWQYPRSLFTTRFSSSAESQ